MRLKAIPILVISGLMVASCGTYDQLLKSRDHVAKYEYALQMYQIGKNNRAINLFENIAPIFSGTEKIDTIKFYTAKSYYRQGDYTMASLMLDEFRKTYTRSPFAEEAEFLYAMGHYEIAPNPELDQSHTLLAIAAFQEYMSRYSESPKVEICQELIEELTDRLYQKAYLVGKNYYDIGYYNSAIHEYKNVLKAYPEITMREKILYLIVKSSYLYARASVESKQRERYYNTIDASLSFFDEFPDSEYLSEVNKMYTNSEKLAKGQDIIDDVASDYELSDKAIKRATKKYSEMFDKVQSGDMTKEQAKIISEQMIEKAKKRAERKGISHQTDSAKLRAIEIRNLEEQAMREQGIIPEVERASYVDDDIIKEKRQKKDKEPKRSRSKQEQEAIVEESQE